MRTRTFHGVAALALGAIILSGPLALAESHSEREGGQEVMVFTDDAAADRARIRGVFTEIVDDDGPVSLNFHLQFRLNSAELTPEARASLARLGVVMQQLGAAGYRFAVIGHTDASGAAGYNQDLSLRRARTVADHLTTRWAVDSAWLQVAGLGESALLAPDRPNDGINRRVEVRVTERPPSPPKPDPEPSASGALTE